MDLLERIRKQVSLGQIIPDGPMAGNKGCTEERADELINEMTNVELLECISSFVIVSVEGVD
jgi:hypothetical protein